MMHCIVVSSRLGIIKNGYPSSPGCAVNLRRTTASRIPQHVVFKVFVITSVHEENSTGDTSRLKCRRAIAQRTEAITCGYIQQTVERLIGSVISKVTDSRSSHFRCGGYAPLMTTALPRFSYWWTERWYHMMNNPAKVQDVCFAKNMHGLQVKAKDLITVGEGLWYPCKYRNKLF